MANMFSGYEQKRIPKNFEDCIQADGVSCNLWAWARYVETLGKILYVIVIIAGVIISATSGFITQEKPYVNQHQIYTDTHTDFSPLVSLISLIVGILGAFFVYLACHILALLIGSLASIVQNTKISADVALLQFQNGAKTYGIESPDKTGSPPSEQFF